MPKATYTPQLLHLFRQYGYDGATLSKISEATGLGKASLYHHFPNGKEEMVTTVLEYLEAEMEQHIFQPLRGDEAPNVRLQRMATQIGQLFEGGQQPCLFATLLMGSARDIFHDQVELLLRKWMGAIAQVLLEAGVEPSLAQELAEDAVILIEGALILSQGLNDLAPFQRTLQRLPQQLSDHVPTKP
jgi:AcrR family transcriptional regulator